MEMHLGINKRLKNIFILLFGSLFSLIAITGKFKLDCIFKKLFGVCCPGCGLTRSLRALLRFDIISSFKYNIFGPILFIIIVIGSIFLIIDIIYNKDNTIKYGYIILGKYYYIIIICLIISMIINNIRGI